MYTYPKYFNFQDTFLVKNCEKSEEKHKWENIFNHSLKKIAALRHRRMSRQAGQIQILDWMVEINESSQKLTNRKFKKIMAKKLMKVFSGYEITKKSGLQIYQMIKSIKGKTKTSRLFYKVFSDQIAECKAKRPNKVQLDRIEKLHAIFEYFNAKLDLRA